MPPRIIPVNPEEPREERVGLALEVLRSGGVVSLPTETFYGLAVDSFNPTALAALNDLKRKPRDSPVLLLLSDAGQVAQVAERLPDLFEPMAKLFWPGPLSLVVPAGPRVPKEVTGGRGTVAVRVPGLALPRRLAEALGRPITGVSANLTGHAPCRTGIEVRLAFPEGVDMIMDGGSSTGGAPSTLLDLTGEEPRVLREGAIPAAALRPFVSTLRKNSV